MGAMTNAYKILVRKLGGKRPHSEGLEVNGRIMLKWILGKYFVD
jgi:hypothetical protein